MIFVSQADRRLSYTKTSAMKELLAERAKARAKVQNQPEKAASLKPVIQQVNGGQKEKDLSSLVQSVKRKMDQNNMKKKRSRK